MGQGRREATLLPCEAEETDEEVGGIYLFGQSYLFLGNSGTQVCCCFFDTHLYEHYIICYVYHHLYHFYQSCIKFHRTTNLEYQL